MTTALCITIVILWALGAALFCQWITDSPWQAKRWSQRLVLVGTSLFWWLIIATCLVAELASVVYHGVPRTYRRIAYRLRRR